MVPRHMRGRAYGFHRAMDHAGAVIGPLIATLFLSFYPGKLRWLFLYSIFPGLIATVFVYLAKRSKSDAAVPPIEDYQKSGGPLSREFYPYFFILSVFTLAGSSDAFLLLKLTGSGVNERNLPILWAALHVVKSLGSLGGGRLSDYIGRRPSIVLGWIWYAVVYAVLGLTNNQLIVVLTFLSYGFYYGLTESAERAFVADMVPSSDRGRAFGLQNLIEGLGALPASLIFGYLWATFNSTVAFTFSAALSALAAILMAIWRFHLRKHE
jgi:MFS family permease